MKTLPLELKIIYVFAVLVLFIFVILVVLVVVTYSKKQQQLFNLQKLNEAEHQTQLLQKEIDRQKEIETERNRISADIHDDIGARISALKLYGEYIQKEYIEVPNLQKEIEEMMKNTDEITQSMRELIWSLKSEQDSLFSLVEFAEKHAEEFLAKSNINLIFQNQTKINTIVHAETRRNVFFSYKELLNNALKHSQASEILIRFWQENNFGMIEILDNGMGISEKKRNLGNGLYHTKTRMENIGGDFLIPSSGKGTKVQLRFLTNSNENFKSK